MKSFTRCSMCLSYEKENFHAEDCIMQTLLFADRLKSYNEKNKARSLPCRDIIRRVLC